jgi:hypothetical protein
MAQLQSTNDTAYSEIGNERRTWLIVREGLLTVAREMRAVGQLRRSVSMSLVGKMLFAAADAIAEHYSLKRSTELGPAHHTCRAELQSASSVNTAT